ncbi:MAG: ACP phosphodiesterase [Crocinitomicaceae bacterium]|nr:DUF479 domain-containing protein [Crocinitomicaceae bacterium]
MNFLGHAYIARNHPELIAGNFAGDGYKGNLDQFDLPKNIIDGIKLHRFIDDFTDHSEQILNAGHIFHDNGIHKIAYIGTDIIMDHFLAREWVRFSTKDYDHFIQAIYLHTDKHLDLLDDRFQSMYKNLKLFGWFFDYPTEHGIRKILTQFSNRIGFENDLVKCLDVYLSHKLTFDKLFASFLVEINEKSVEFIQELQ